MAGYTVETDAGRYHSETDAGCPNEYCRRREAVLADLLVACELAHGLVVEIAEKTGCYLTVSNICFIEDTITKAKRVEEREGQNR